MTEPSGERSWTSWRYRLPALIVAVVLLVVVAFTVAAYRHVERGLESVAATRLEGATQRLRTLLGESAAQQLEQVDSVAERPEVRAAVVDGSESGRATALALFDSLTAASDATVGVVLRGPAGVVVTHGDTASAGSVEGRGVGPLRVAGDHVRYALSVPAGAGASVTLVRRLGGNPETARTISGLIGEDATFLLGNRSGDGEVWTDLAAPTAGPPVDALGGEISGYVDQEGRRRTGVGRPIPGTPWLLWVGLPHEIIRGPLAAFIRDITLTAMLLLALGALVGWRVSRSITRPLLRVTHAAEAIAAGDTARRIGIDGEDEIGRLGQAFDVMAREVNEATSRLEQRVTDRTAELEETLGELEAAQEELVRKERLAILGELAGGVGHELRNPLGVMTNAIFYLESVLPEQPEEVREYLGILQHQVQLSEKIVTDLLDFARVKPPQREAVDMEALMREQVERAEPAENIRVRYDFEPGLSTAMVDRSQVGQVALNLVTNAAQAMEENGGGSLVLRGRSDGGRLSIAVEDSGPGIDADIAEKIFEPLFTTKARGIGLGLSVSRSLLEANGGTLDLETEPGRGATFTMGLPTREPTS